MCIIFKDWEIIIDARKPFGGGSISIMEVIDSFLKFIEIY